MNGRTIRKYLFLPLVAIAALSMTGCTKGEYTAPGGTVNESGFRLSVVTKNMSREEVVTRASDPKTEAEREIKELHVFLFGPDGKYLQARQDGGERMDLRGRTEPLFVLERAVVADGDRTRYQGGAYDGTRTERAQCVNLGGTAGS